MTTQGSQKHCELLTKVPRWLPALKGARLWPHLLLSSPGLHCHCGPSPCHKVSITRESIWPVPTALCPVFPACMFETQGYRWSHLVCTGGSEQRLLTGELGLLNKTQVCVHLITRPYQVTFLSVEIPTDHGTTL